MDPITVKENHFMDAQTPNSQTQLGTSKSKAAMKSVSAMNSQLLMTCSLNCIPGLGDPIVHLPVLASNILK